MTILAIDAATDRASVAVVRAGEMLFAEECLSGRSHSAALFSVLERARATAAAFDRIAIGLGPGSYAGTRIAISAGLGMQLMLGGELVGIPSVAALEGEAAEYVAVGDARRETFYWTRVRAGVCVEGPLLMEAATFQARLEAERATVLSSDPAATWLENGRVLQALPSARKLARLARQEEAIFARGDLEPIYLREPHITLPVRNRALIGRAGGSTTETRRGAED